MENRKRLREKMIRRGIERRKMMGRGMVDGERDSGTRDNERDRGKKDGKNENK